MRGRAGEDRVSADLEANGWRVLDRNWRGAGGELDLVVLKNGRLRFVEVKARSEDDPVGVEAVGTAKQAHLVRAARAWIRSHEPDVEEMAFLVAMVEGDRITWYDDAFDVE